jgi:hypothetical protein
MMKVFRPFWSYDIKKTEVWLSDMAKKGYFLVGLNRWARCFFFQQVKAKPLTYRIGYGKIKGFSLSRSLLDEGWIKVLQSGKWYVTSNETPLEQIKASTVRDDLIKRNRMIMYIFSGILIYLIGIAIFNLTLMSSSLFEEGTVEVVESPFWILTYSLLGFAIAIFVLSIYSVFTINKSNKYLINEKNHKPQGVNHNEGKLSKEREKQLKLSGRMIVKRKFGWMYSPDKLEKWLETMEELGYNLYRVSRTGTAFYFIIGSPRGVSYCADYQNISNESYYDMHRDAGWKSVFISFSSLQRWTIWSQEFSEGEERPKIYSDKSFHLKQARKVAIAYTILFLPLTIMYILNIGLFIGGMFNNGTTRLSLLNTVLFLFCIFGFCSFTVRTWMYYMRLRKAL